MNMKKILTLSIATVFASAFCFARSPTSPAPINREVINGDGSVTILNPRVTYAGRLFHLGAYRFLGTTQGICKLFGHKQSTVLNSFAEVSYTPYRGEVAGVTSQGEVAEIGYSQSYVTAVTCGLSLKPGIFKNVFKADAVTKNTDGSLSYSNPRLFLGDKVYWIDSGYHSPTGSYNRDINLSAACQMLGYRHGVGTLQRLKKAAPSVRFVTYVRSEQYRGKPSIGDSSSNTVVLSSLNCRKKTNW